LIFNDILLLLAQVIIVFLLCSGCRAQRVCLVFLHYYCHSSVAKSVPAGLNRHRRKIQQYRGISEILSTCSGHIENWKTTALMLRFSIIFIASSQIGHSNEAQGMCETEMKTEGMTGSP
jgi:hypothetical protein